MRLVIQRVKEASVTVDGAITGSIGKGLLVLLGIHKEDTPKTIPWYINKLLNLRIFEDEKGKMNLSVKEIEGQILLVSQFTLYANCQNGRRPDFIQAAPPQIAEPLYKQFASEIKNELGEVQTGKFGALMEVSLVNHGPVTIILEQK